MPSSRFYDDHEAEAILKLAVSESVNSGAMTRERLLATAAELGISEDAVERAERQLADQREEAERQRREEREFAEYKRFRSRKAWSGVSGWISTSIVLVGIDLLTSRHITWSVWPVGIWGLFEIGHLIETLLSPPMRGPKFERWRRRQADRR